VYKLGALGLHVHGGEKDNGEILPAMLQRNGQRGIADGPKSVF